MVVYEYTWIKKDEFLQNLRDLLKPVILAEGYDLFAEDAGKQVFARGERSITQKSKHYYVTSPPVEEVRSATKLTVGYVLTPSETRARFMWENPYYYHPQVHDEAMRFYEYLEDWYKAVACSETKVDPPPLEGQ